MNKHDDMTDVLQYDPNLTQATVQMIGDKRILCSVVQLLAYIRNAIRNQKQMHIDLDIGSNIAGGDFMFDVNGLEVSDYIAKDRIQIN